MDLKLKPFDFAQAATKAGMADVARRVEAKTRLDATGQANAVDKPSFQNAFSGALNSISQSQATAATCSARCSSTTPPLA